MSLRLPGGVQGRPCCSQPEPSLGCTAAAAALHAWPQRAAAVAVSVAGGAGGEARGSGCAGTRGQWGDAVLAGWCLQGSHSQQSRAERAPPRQGMGRLPHAAAGLGVGPGRLPGLRHSLKQEHRWHRGPFYPEDLRFPPLLGKGLVVPSCCTAEGLCVSPGARAGFGAARLGLSPASGGWALRTRCTCPGSEDSGLHLPVSCVRRAGRAPGWLSPPL